MSFRYYSLAMQLSVKVAPCWIAKNGFITKGENLPVKELMKAIQQPLTLCICVVWGQEDDLCNFIRKCLFRAHWRRIKCGSCTLLPVCFPMHLAHRCKHATTVFAYVIHGHKSHNSGMCCGVQEKMWRVPFSPACRNRRSFELQHVRLRRAFSMR